MNNQQNNKLKQLQLGINQTKETNNYAGGLTNKQSQEYLKTQIANSQEHLAREWGLLKKENNLSMVEIREIVYNIEKESQYLGECQTKLQITKQQLNNYE